MTRLHLAAVPLLLVTGAVAAQPPRPAKPPADLAAVPGTGSRWSA